MRVDRLTADMAVLTGQQRYRAAQCIDQRSLFVGGSAGGPDREAIAPINALPRGGGRHA